MLVTHKFKYFRMNHYFRILVLCFFIGAYRTLAVSNFCFCNTNINFIALNEEKSNYILVKCCYLLTIYYKMLVINFVLPCNEGLWIKLRTNNLKQILQGDPSYNEIEEYANFCMKQFNASFGKVYAKYQNITDHFIKKISKKCFRDTLLPC